MTDHMKKQPSLQVSSDQLQAELIEIKERLGALETIASISNRKVVEEYVRNHLRTDKAKPIMRECKEPRSREQLIAKLGFKSSQALDHHLKHLRDDDLIRQHLDEGGSQVFEWSNLFKRLPKSTIQEILED